jgi:hypothetical protein
MEILESKITCGFCSLGGRHDLCPSGVWSNEKLYRCPCGCERSLEIKCLDCNTRIQDDVDPITWKCRDRDACKTEIELRLANNPVIQQIREIRERSKERVTNERQIMKRAAGRPTSGSCLHCGEPTKGGKFLPGHDATWVTEQVAAIKAGTPGDKQRYEDLMARCVEMGISDALQGKIKKRVVLR